MAADIRVNSDGDWTGLVDRGLKTVLDPMVFRAGEIFLRGRTGRAFPAATVLKETDAWNYLDKNILAIGFFIDALVLNERLPIFNYGDTFDTHLNFGERSFAAINDAAEDAVIIPVDVLWGAYMPIKASALEALRQQLAARVAAGGAWLPEQEARSILDELSQVEFQWDISLGSELEQLLPEESDRRLARLMLGGLIFSRYADLLSSEHWLQPKRAALYVQAMAAGRAPARDDERRMFAWLAKQFGMPVLEVWQPTFLHYVLDRASSLQAIPKIVAELRRSDAVSDYRIWRKTALEEWRGRGGLSETSLRTMDRLRKALSESGGKGAKAAEAGVAWVETISKMTPEAAAKAAAKSLPMLDWILNDMPGRQHVKLMADSVHARGRYEDIKVHVKSLWERG